MFFAYPVIAIVGRGLTPDGALDLDPLREVVNDPALRHVIWFTVWQAALSTVLTVAIALPGAYMLTRYEFPGRRVVRALVTVPFVLPTVVVGTAFAALLGTGGPLARSRTRPDRVGDSDRPRVLQLRGRGADGRWPVVASRPSPGRGRPDARCKPVACVPRGDASLRSVPQSRPRAAVVFLFTFTSFGVILILGGPRYATLETEIYRQTAQLLNLPLAAALTLVQLAAVAVPARPHRTYPRSRAGRAPVARRRRNRTPPEDGA